MNLKNPLSISYHDKEWGRPLHEDRMHFEMLVLEGAQAGLSWETILNKRSRYRKVFRNFDPKKVSLFTKKDMKRILEDKGVVRNRLKVESSISNAKAFLKIQKEWGSFDSYIWSFLNEKIQKTKIKNLKKLPSQTKLSEKISKDLKKRGFSFVGPTIIYSYMQAAGLVNDHLKGCYLYGKNLKR